MANDKLMARGDAEVLLHNLEVGKHWMDAKVQAYLPVPKHLILSSEQAGLPIPRPVRKGKVVDVGSGQCVTVAWEDGYTTEAPMFLLEVIG